MRTTAAQHEDDDDAPIAPRSVFVGRVFGEKYRLDEEIGSGGMGVVLRGVHVVTGRAIAVKVLRTERSTESITKRFLREARVAATLDHPNAVGVLDCGKTHDGHVYQVLELLEGETLRDRLARGPMSLERTLALVLPVLHALEAAHVNGVIHRDLKPGNVFLAKNKHGRVVPKLLDFGIAKLFEPLRSAASSGEALTPTTQSGTIIGTPAYMSPEQARGEIVTKASDLFSMGAVLFECLTGEVPFDGVNPNVVMARIVLERARRVDEVTPSIPPALAAAVDCALSPLPADRPPSAAALASLLREAAKEAGITLPPEGSSDCADEDPETATTLVHTSRRRDARPRSVASTSAHTQSDKKDMRVSRASTGLIVGAIGLLLAVVAIALVWSSANEAAQRTPRAPEGEDLGLVEDAIDEASDDAVEPEEASESDEVSDGDEAADDVVEAESDEAEAVLAPATDRRLPRAPTRPATGPVLEAVAPIEPPAATTEPPTSSEGLPEIREW
ncbi:MAG: serine/threonine protein kinase [Deltaproteobacteria bacterium]|nr:serine/threonine protein kinase [Deltaproteobacteria bacterium]